MIYQVIRIVFLIVITMLILMTGKVFAQKIYVAPTSKEYHTVIVQALYDRNIYVPDKDESNYTIRCIVTKTPGYGKHGEGYIQVLDSRTDEIVLKSEKEKGMRSIFKGMEDPYTVIFSTVVKKQLPDILSELAKLEMPPIVAKDEVQKAAVIKSKEEKLIELKSFYEKKLITLEEYEEQKRKILNQ